ncbi:Fe2+ transport system protein FeoA [Desulfotomaculum arcticum]|uniref:Fe2+ transport system protein FeoA n=1 Tax=Desulfotruncus arcticus DSM 17038 TaxID=1121424 RepID=A0A1I2QM72_9FIRM|nr:ferrous iron transport protein A [Desulfotruncus arcticus]SFG27327.1 Fe2+ transport system protein FeoA [Desulfotomaculum arcticum] [Desulfotruncus arcticus DSM 17038]
MTLDKVRRGEQIKVISIGDSRTKERALRMGIDAGTVLTCSEVVPAGPVVVSKNRQELAIGRAFARHINVEVLARADATRLAKPALKSETCR